MITKYRHELKFLFEENDLVLLETRLRTIMKIDAHADSRGEYLIRSIYFDDIYKRCFFDNEDGVDPRYKYRIRAYNLSTKHISLERKSKCRDMTGKESLSLSKEETDLLLEGRVSDIKRKESLWTEFITDYYTRYIRPRVMIEYVRTPYVYSLGNVRVTFDRNISASSESKDLFDENICKVNVLKTNQHVLEVKYDDFLPDCLFEIINDSHMMRSTFSKFYYGCKAINGRI